MSFNKIKPIRVSCIYAIVNAQNGHVYIGSTVDFHDRVWAHKTDLKRGDHHCEHLQRAWNKYGSESFVFGVLELVFDSSQLLFVEQIYLDRLPNLYNSNPIAAQPPVHYGPRPEWFGKKISASKIGKPSPLKGISRPFYVSPESRKKAGDKMRGRKRSPEVIEKTASKLRGQKRSPLAEEHKQSIGRSNRGKTRVFTETHKQNLKKAAKARPKRGPQPEETKRKIKDSLRGFVPVNRRTLT